MRDLTRPTGPRTIRILSAVCNFRAFSDVDDRRDFLANLQTEAQTKQQRLDERAAESQEVEEELASLQYVYLCLKDIEPLTHTLGHEHE